jgi:hypothetical protein
MWNVEYEIWDGRVTTMMVMMMMQRGENVKGREGGEREREEQERGVSTRFDSFDLVVTTPQWPRGCAKLRPVPRIRRDHGGRGDCDGGYTMMLLC